MPYRRIGYASPATNQTPLYVSRKVVSGQNTRQDPSRIGDDEVTVAYNVDLSTPGRTEKRPGQTLIGNDVGTRTYALSPYYPTGGTASLYRVEGVNVRKWTGSGNWSSALYSSLTSGLETTITQGGESGENEVLFFQNLQQTALRMNSSDSFQDLGSGATSPPQSLYNLFLNNRWWVLKNGFLYFSDAFPTDYSTAFSAANGFRFSGYGGDRGLIAVRANDSASAASIIVLMQNAIVGLTPSATPVSTDRPYIITTSHGGVNRRCCVQMGDDIAYLASDGIRSLKRTVQDQLQIGVSYPLSYRLKDEFDNINWTQSDKFHMVYWQDKLFFFFVALPGTDINRAWVYWPALDDGTGKGWAVITGWTVTAAAKFFVSGQERLYGGNTDGKVFQLWSGGDDNNTAINMQIETREEDFDLPAIYKYGGELELEAEASGNYDIDVYASTDGGDYIQLGTLNLLSDSPALPIALPFSLQSGSIVSQKFHLDPLGRFKRIKFKFVQDDNNSSDTIRILSYNVATFRDQYESE